MQKLTIPLVAAVLMATLGSCSDAPTAHTDLDAVSSVGKAVPLTRVVEVTAISGAGEHRFELSADEVPSGWTTFRFDNTAGIHHFGFIVKVPKDVTVEQYHQEITQVFQNFMDLALGKDPSFPDAGFDLPTWFEDLEFMGGPGLTGPHLTSQTTVNLEPGSYILECYMKTGSAVFHSTRGMLAGFTVTGGAAGAPEPHGTLQMDLLNSGIQVADQVRPGKHTVAVDFAEQQVHENFGGNDVHLVRIEDGTDLSALAAWMDSRLEGGLAPPAPAEFLGGAHDQPAGHTAYFTVNLRPGTYAWIAEVDDPAGKNMLKTFTVPFGRSTGH